VDSRGAVRDFPTLESDAPFGLAPLRETANSKPPATVQQANSLPRQFLASRSTSSAHASEIAAARLRPFRAASASTVASKSGAIVMAIWTLFFRAGGLALGAAAASGARPMNAFAAGSLATDLGFFVIDMICFKYYFNIEII
jgi:hypothetical protein